MDPQEQERSVLLDAEILENPITFSPPLNFASSQPFFPSDYSKMTLGNLALFIYSLAKIALSLIIYMGEEDFCSEPLDVWLLMIIANEALLIIYLVIAFYWNHWLHNKQSQMDFLGRGDFTFGYVFAFEEISFLSGSFEGSDLIQFLNNLDNYNFHLRLNNLAEKSFVFLTFLRHINQFSYLILFLWGCFLLTMKNSNCASLSPQTVAFAHILIIIGLLYIFLPLFLLLSICFCIPCLLISSLFCSPRSTTSIEKDFIKRLERAEFSSQTFGENEDCVICRGSFQDKDKLIVLPCSRKHFFHEDCVEKWLDISCLCPICRADLNRKLKEGAEGKNDLERNSDRMILEGIEGFA